MMGTKRRASRDMARMDGKHFSLDSVLTVLSFLILVVVVVIPMVMIVYNTFFYEGKFDTSLFTQIILDPGNVAAMWNTIKIALLVTLFGTIIGLFFAWLLGRSDIPLKGLMRSMFTIPYMFPPFFGAMAWELLLSPRSGYLNKWLMATFGLSKAPFNINSIGGIIFVECSYYFPFVFMQVVSALERMDPTLEESARIAGAKQWYVIRRITMPLVLPATSAGALLILTSSLSHFGVPSILGFSKKIYTLPTRIYQLNSRGRGAFHPAGDCRHAGAVAAKDRSALGQLRHHQGQIHASDAHQAARRQNPPAGDLAAVAGRHRGRAAGDDYSRRPAQGLRPAAQA